MSVRARGGILVGLMLAAGCACTIACETSVMTAVLRRACRKIGSCHAVLKLSRPTQLPLSEPAVASVKLR